MPQRAARTRPTCHLDMLDRLLHRPIVRWLRKPRSGSIPGLASLRAAQLVFDPSRGQVDPRQIRAQEISWTQASGCVSHSCYGTTTTFSSSASEFRASTCARGNCGGFARRSARRRDSAADGVSSIRAIGRLDARVHGGAARCAAAAAARLADCALQFCATAPTAATVAGDERG